MAENNTVLIGKKGTMPYVTAVLTLFNQGAPDVTIKARGKSISRAVDVAEVVRNKFILDVKLEPVLIGTEEVQSEEGKTLRISTIELKLLK